MADPPAGRTLVDRLIGYDCACPKHSSGLPEAERTEPFQIVLVGWRERRRDLRIAPIIWELKKRSSCEFVIERFRRHWAWDRGYTMTTAPDGEPQIFEQIRREIRSRAVHESPETLIQALVRGLKEYANARPTTVGTASLIVLLTPFNSPHARIRFVPDTRNPSSTADAVETFSPWIVAPPMAWSPARTTTTGGPGGFTSTGTGHSWVIEGPAQRPGPRRVSHSSQKRPPDPQRFRRR